jgi:hypothetical protein
MLSAATLRSLTLIIRATGARLLDPAIDRSHLPLGGWGTACGGLSRPRRRSHTPGFWGRWVGRVQAGRDGWGRVRAMVKASRSRSAHRQVAGQAQPQPRKQVTGHAGGHVRGPVDRERDQRQVLQTGVLAGADRVLDPDVGAMAGLQERFTSSASRSPIRVLVAPCRSTASGAAARHRPR